MAPSEAEAKGLTRLSKHPKSSKYGRQNPVAERWNSEEQLVLWREAWANITNRFLERAGNEERIDHRSYAERGLEEQPTVHEGVAARAMEAAERRESKYEGELKAALAQYREFREQAKNMDADALEVMRQEIRPDMEREAYQQAREVYGKRYDSTLMKQSRKDVAAMLGEQERRTSIQQQIRENRVKASLHEKQEPAR